jgi:hypothetical protein
VFAPKEVPGVAAELNIELEVLGFAESAGLGAPNSPPELCFPPRLPNNGFCPVAPFEGGFPAGVVDTAGPKEKAGFAGVMAAVEALPAPILNPDPPELLVFRPENMPPKGAVVGVLFSFPPTVVDVLLLPKLKPPPPPPPPPPKESGEGAGVAEVPVGFPKKLPTGEEAFAPPKIEGDAAPDVLVPPNAVPCEPPVVFAPNALAAGVLPPPNMFVPGGLDVAVLAAPNIEEEAGVAGDPKRPLELV